MRVYRLELTMVVNLVEQMGIVTENSLGKQKVLMLAPLKVELMDEVTVDMKVDMKVVKMVPQKAVM